MQSIHILKRCGAFIALCFCAVSVPAAQPKLPDAKQPRIPAFYRFHDSFEADPHAPAHLLLGELNCTSCHKAESVHEPFIAKKEAPILDGVGNRVRRGFLKRFIDDPQSVKSGTTMPRLFLDQSEKDRAATVEALVHFLASTGSLKQEPVQKKLVANGRDLYHKVGCVACHGTRNADGTADMVFPTSIPLGDLKAKYSITSLKTFLDNPHATRPSGRMPHLLNGQEPAEVANFLLQGINVAAAPVNLAWSYYEGAWDKLPDFDTMKPVATGQCGGFDLTQAHRIENMAMRFEGFLKIDTEGEYKFHLTSDDGSKMLIDGKLALSNDGVHAPTTVAGNAVKLTKGMHKFVAAVFNAGGGVELAVDIEGPGIGKQSVIPFLFLTENGNPKPPEPEKDDDDNFTVNKDLVAKGRELFTTVGCASCHSLKIDGKALESKLTATPLAKLKFDGGCLSEKSDKATPNYYLSHAQLKALQNLRGWTPKGEPETKQVITRKLMTFNCYACHERGKMGGPEEDEAKFFTSTQPEMGEEGRMPPPLDGVGAKLNSAYLKQILDKGAHERPYMHTRMPGFGESNVGMLVAAFEQVDTATPKVKVDFTEPLTKVKSHGRFLVGDKGLSCIKCHTFGGQKAEGIQGMDMSLMVQRLKHDWYHAYLVDPQKYRPGTRMPSGWPNGNSSVPEVLEGNTPKQIEAIWLYLADGAKAAAPSGLRKNAIPLIPDKEAIMYRNFIEGAGARAIGVGYPEHLSLAFDANDLRIAMIWQGAFIDAGRHWNDRGQGFEPPAGDNVLHFATGPDFAILDKQDDAWPAKPAKDLGFQFKGYTLSDDQRPTFHYTLNDLKIDDFTNPATVDKTTIFRRTLTLTAPKAVDNFYFRAAVGNKIEDDGKGWFKIDGEWKMRIETTGTPKIRKIGDKMELLVPVSFKDGAAKIIQEFHW